MNATVDELRPALASASSEASSQSLVPTLDEILKADPDQFVAKHSDIAAVNLACARGLQNCNEADFPKYMTLLDQMAEVVKARTEKSWRLFKLKPAEFRNSENVFRVLTMEHILRMQFGVKYDDLVKKLTEGGKSWKSADSTEMFIHGVLSEKRTGTCSSLPTFSIAVGRRLGYPLKLVRVPKHTLFRWDDGKEKFNIQHSDAGSDLQPDEFFHTSPRPWNAEMFAMNERTKVWLHSMTPRQEASKFLCNRAIFLYDNGRFQEGIEAISAAQRFDPGNPACPEIWLHLEQKMIGVRNRQTISQHAVIHGMNIPTQVTRIEPSGDHLLNIIDPFRDRSKGPKHVHVQVNRVVEDRQEADRPYTVRLAFRGKEQQ